MEPLLDLGGVDEEADGRLHDEVAHDSPGEAACERAWVAGASPVLY